MIMPRIPSQLMMLSVSPRKKMDMSPTQTKLVASSGKVRESSPYLSASIMSPATLKYNAIAMMNGTLVISAGSCSEPFLKKYCAVVVRIVARMTSQYASF